jgi:hypothetical protein
VLVRRPRHGLMPHGTNLRGIRLVDRSPRGLTNGPSSHALGLAFRVADATVSDGHLPPKRPDTTTPSPGVSRPTTHEARGSDLCRVCLTRLCGAFRFSQPLDALLRLQPFRPCFVPVAPLGFRLQRFSPCGSEAHLPVDPALLAVTRPRPKTRARPTPRIFAPARSGFPDPGLAGCRSPFRSWRCSLRGITLVGLGPALPRNLHSWA